MADIKWNFKFRDDQRDFLVATMDYVMAGCEERFVNSPDKPFEEFMAHSTHDRAKEIRDYIVETST